MIIDHKELSDQALKGIAEAFLVSHFSDGDDQLKFSDWVEEVIKKVKNKELLIEFSEADESVTLKLPEDVLRQAQDERTGSGCPSTGSG